MVLFDADKLDVLGAIGAARTLGYALKVRTPFFCEPSEQFLQSGNEIAGELHSAYHEYLFKLSKISACLYTKSGREMANHRQEFLNQFFEELAAEFRGKGSFNNNKEDPIMQPSLQEVIEIAQKAGEILQAGVGTDLKIHHKGRIDLVTKTTDFPRTLS